MFNMPEPGANIPAFLMKLWNLLENKSFNDLVCWDKSGLSFHVLDQSRFAHEVLPHYFKHNNISSFIRQLNMYGFRKMASIDQGALKVEKDELEFAHSYFQREHPELLQFIKRKLPSTHGERHVKLNPDDVTLVLSDVTALKNKQEDMNSRLESLKRENVSVWSELASLRRKYDQQAQVLNKLVRFLMSTMTRKPTLSGMKRKFPAQLMLSDSPASSSGNRAKRPNLGRPIEESSPDVTYSVESPLEQALVPAKNGPIIHDVTDLIQASNIDSKNEDYYPSKIEPTSPETDIFLTQSPASDATLPFTPVPAETPPISTPSPAPLLSPPNPLLGGVTDTGLPLSPTQTPPPATQTPPPATLNTPVLPSDSANKEKTNAQDVLLPSASNTVSLPSSNMLTPKDLSDHLETMDVNLDSLREVLGQQFPILEPEFFSGLFSSDNPDIPPHSQDMSWNVAASRGTGRYPNDLHVVDENSMDGGAGNELMQYSGGEIPSLLDGLNAEDLSFPTDAGQAEEESEEVPFNPNLFLQ